MAARLVRSLAPNLNGSGSVSAKAHLQKGHFLGSIPTFSRRFCAQSVASSSESKICYNVHLKLPPGREEEFLSNAEEKEKWYHSFISGGKRTGVGSDKDPRIKHACKFGRGLGFAALLTREEALALKEYDGFFFASPSIAIPSDFPRRRKNGKKKTSLQRGLEEYIFASDEIKEKMMAGRIQQDKIMRMAKEKLQGSQPTSPFSTM